MENRYELAKDIAADGDRTRSLITAQYEATLNRQLGDANAEIIALRNRAALDAATNGITLTNTNNINQMQQQTQSQQQYAQLAHMIYGLGQNITNGAINVGSGTLTANPTNTNTAIR
jgi:ribosome biogenesis SPOUT family RNA methylase Rps3